MKTFLRVVHFLFVFVNVLFKNQHENKISVVDMRMLRCMCGKTRCDGIRNDNIRERKLVENRLR